MEALAGSNQASAKGAGSAEASPTKHGQDVTGGASPGAGSQENGQDKPETTKRDDGDEPFEADYLKAEQKRRVAMLSKEVRELRDKLLSEVEEIIER